MKVFLVAVAVAVIGTGFYFADTAGYLSRSSMQGFIFKSSDCDQSATTTDCATLRVLNAAATPTPSTILAHETWMTYTSNRLGVTFTYPSNDTALATSWNAANNDSFVATIPLESGAFIQILATSKEYQSEKDGFPAATEGFIERKGKYYALTQGKPAQTSIPVDEVWKLSNGDDIPVVFAKDDGSNSEYSKLPMAASVNLPGKNFTGIGFVLFTKDLAPPSSEDIATFKKVVTSVRIAK